MYHDEMSDENGFIARVAARFNRVLTKIEGFFKGPPGPMGPAGLSGLTPDVIHNPMDYVEFAPLDHDSYPLTFADSITSKDLTENEYMFLTNLKARSGVRIDSVHVESTNLFGASSVTLNVTVVQPMPTLILKTNVKRGF